MDSEDRAALIDRLQQALNNNGTIHELSISARAALFHRCLVAISEQQDRRAVGEPVAWMYQWKIEGSKPELQFDRFGGGHPDLIETPLYAHPEGDRDTGKREFCAYCGAGVGKFKREGEGTCNRCDPEGRARFHSPPAVSRDQTDAPTSQPTVLPDPERGSLLHCGQCGKPVRYPLSHMCPGISGAAVVKPHETQTVTQNEPSSDSIAPVGLGMQEESKPQTPIGKLNAAYIKEQAERKAAGGKLVDGVYHPPESAASVGSGLWPTNKEIDAMVDTLNAEHEELFRDGDAKSSYLSEAANLISTMAYVHSFSPAAPAVDYRKALEELVECLRPNR